MMSAEGGRVLTPLPLPRLGAPPRRGLQHRRARPGPPQRSMGQRRRSDHGLAARPANGPPHLCPLVPSALGPVPTMASLLLTLPSRPPPDLRGATGHRQRKAGPGRGVATDPGPPAAGPRHCGHFKPALAVGPQWLQTAGEPPTAKAQASHPDSHARSLATAPPAGQVTGHSPALSATQAAGNDSRVCIGNHAKCLGRAVRGQVTGGHSRDLKAPTGNSASAPFQPEGRRGRHGPPFSGTHFGKVSHRRPVSRDTVRVSANTCRVGHVVVDTQVHAPDVCPPSADGGTRVREDTGPA